MRVPERRAARVLLLDAAGRVLLVRAHDVDDPGRTWWFTLGGGLDPGEDARAAAVREVAEETGLVLAPSALRGPVATRRAVLDFASGTVVQHEEYFAALAPEGFVPSTGGWTPEEVAGLDELAWWTAQDLEHVGVELFPPDLPRLLSRVAAGDLTPGHLPA